MFTRAALTATAVVAITTAACSAGKPADQGSTPRPPSIAPSPTQTALPTQTESAEALDASCPAEPTDPNATCQVVPATSNIFGAGHAEPPAPGGGGAGTLPPVWAVPPGVGTMRVVDAAGSVVPISGMSGPNGAAGDMTGRTSVSSWGGVSGIAHPRNGMFLVGVFLADAEPVDPAPDMLSFDSQTDDFEELAPEIAQTFFIGDGANRTFVVPAGATRLYLGFADAYLYVGSPGWYGNNTGQLAVTVSFSE